jgi:hypothetical protein
MKAMALTKVGPAEKRPLSLIELPTPRPADKSQGFRRCILFSPDPPQVRRRRMGRAIIFYITSGKNGRFWILKIEFS